MKLRAVTAAIHDMAIVKRSSFTEMVERLLRLLPSDRTSRAGVRKSARSVVPIIGRGASFLFGLATENQLDALRKKIADVKLLSEVSL